MSDVAAPLARLPDNPLAAVARADFPIALRGYDRDAVDAYVRRTSELVAELHATRSPEIAVRRALERVGEEVAGVLGRAHETAQQITTQSRREAEERLRMAHRDAERIVADAKRQLVTLDADTDRVWDERRRIVDDIRELSAELLELADSATERLAPAQEPAADDELANNAEPVTEIIDFTGRASEAATTATESADEDEAAGEDEPATTTSKHEPSGEEESADDEDRSER